ncbi:MAG: AAA family ATPase [Candidatus Rokubacteria bacterium]|nr:AAA family ATPase [Candidatus Rokubacteria bacterium]
MTKGICSTTLLPDDPAGEDAFGSHQRIAKAIAHLIREDAGGRSIGLAGPYGSGKSTVVRLLQSLARAERASSEIAVFVSDAWAHQGDPLRRAFLESLVTFLVNQGWTKRERWKDELDLLTRRREDNQTTSEPILTVPGKLVAASALLVPIGYTLFSKAGQPDQFLGVRLWVWGLFLALSPILVALASWLFYRPKDGVVSLLVQKTRETRQSSTVRSPDPTSIEFRSLFSSVMGEALSHPKRRLVVVMDNIDRLDGHQALSIWATMRTFFETETGEQEHSRTSNLWLVVPFDPKGIRTLLEQRLESAAEDAAAVFLDKTFQMTFRVPPLVLSDWRKFLCDQLAAAFPAEHHREEFDTIYRLYRLKGIPPEGTPSPRSIKLFVNSVGALHRQWGDEIPLVMQALYAVYADSLKESVSGLTKEDFLEPAVLALIGEPEWRRYLAALHFNAPPDKALEVLIKRQVEDALVKGESEPLRKLLFVPGFMTVCEQVLEEHHLGWAEKEPVALAATALAVSGIESSSSLQLAQVWRWLKMGVGSVKQWPMGGELVGNGIFEIVRHAIGTEKERLAERVLSSLSNALPAVEHPDETAVAVAAKQWVGATLPVVTGISTTVGEELVNAHFAVPGGANEYIEVATALQEVGAQKVQRYYRPKATREQIVAELVRRCAAGHFDVRHANVVWVMAEIENGWRWHELFNTANQRLRGGTVLRVGEVLGCVLALLYLAWHAKVTEAQDILKQLATEGHLMHHLHQANAERQRTAIAVCMLPILESAPSGDQRAAIGNSGAGQNAYRAILQSPGEYGDVVRDMAELALKMDKVPTLLAAHTASVAAPFLAATLEVIATRDDAHATLTADLLISHYPRLASALNVTTLHALVRNLVSRGELLSRLKGHEFSADLAALYRLAGSAGSEEEAKEVKAYLASELQEITESVWVDALAQEGSLLELLLWLLEDGAPLGLTEAFADALIGHAKNSLEGGNPPARFQRDWSRLPLALQQELQETFLRDLRDVVLARSERTLLPALMLYGSQLIESGLLDERADEVVRQLGKDILERLEAAEVAWLDRLLRKSPGILDRCPRASKTTLRQRVESVLLKIDPSSPARTGAEGIARTLGIDVQRLVSGVNDTRTESG